MLKKIKLSIQAYSNIIYIFGFELKFICTPMYTCEKSPPIACQYQQLEIEVTSVTYHTKVGETIGQISPPYILSS
jgi:hypothetical protein